MRKTSWIKPTRFVEYGGEMPGGAREINYRIT
jgi:hypothetical protein